MKFVGSIYNNDGTKICEFNSVSRNPWENNTNDVLIPENKIKFENYSIHEFEIVKIAQLYKAICEMI